MWVRIPLPPPRWGSPITVEAAQTKTNIRLSLQISHSDRRTPSQPPRVGNRWIPVRSWSEPPRGSVVQRQNTTILKMNSGLKRVGVKELGGSKRVGEMDILPDSPYLFGTQLGALSNRTLSKPTICACAVVPCDSRARWMLGPSSGRPTLSESRFTRSVLST